MIEQAFVWLLMMGKPGFVFCVLNFLDHHWEGDDFQTEHCDYAEFKTTKDTLRII